MIYPASGTGAWEAALVNTLSPGDRVLMAETGHFATLWQKIAGEARPRGRVPARRLAPRRRPGSDREAAARRRRQAHQGGLRRAQRDLDRRRFAHRRSPEGDRRRRPSGALHGRHDLVARLDRLPARRMGRRRHRRRLAEGPDAAAGPVLQLHLGQGARRLEDGEAAAQLLGLGRDDRQRQERLLPVHAGHQPALRPARSAQHAARRRRPRRRVRAPPAPRRGDAARGARLGPRSPGARSARVFGLAHRGADARRPRRRPRAQDDPRSLRHVARHRPRQARAARCSASATSATSTTSR